MTIYEFIMQYSDICFMRVIIAKPCTILFRGWVEDLNLYWLNLKISHISTCLYGGEGRDKDEPALYIEVL